MNTFDTIVISLGVGVATTLLVNHLTSNPNKALATCKGSKASQPTSAPLTRGWKNAACLGTKSDVETEFAACPLGPTCSIGGVCACTFCGTKPNGVQNVKTEQSGSIQSWGSRPYSCGRSACYASAVKRSTSCVTQVVATQGAAGTCGWGKCSDFACAC